MNILICQTHQYILDNVLLRIFLFAISAIKNIFFLYLECRHICRSFLFINATCTNIVFTIRYVVIHTAYSILCILRITKSSLLYSMSSYILRIPFLVYYV